MSQTFSVTMSAEAEKKMEAMGWADAVDGKEPKFQNSHYMTGYDQGRCEMENE